MYFLKKAKKHYFYHRILNMAAIPIWSLICCEQAFFGKFLWNLISIEMFIGIILTFWNPHFSIFFYLFPQQNTIICTIYSLCLFFFVFCIAFIVFCYFCICDVNNILFIVIHCIHHCCNYLSVFLVLKPTDCHCHFAEFF